MTVIIVFSLLKGANEGKLRNAEYWRAKADTTKAGTEMICPAFASLLIVGKLFEKLDDNPNFDLILLGAGIVFSILLISYATFKSYPMDYNATGKLIVNPVKMALEAYKDVGFCMGILISWVIERRFINFSSEGPIERRFLRIGGAYIGYMIIMNIIYPLIKSSFNPQIANLLNFFIFPFFVILIVPAIIKFFQNRSKDVYEDTS